MEPMISVQIEKRIEDAGIIAVLVIDDPKHAVPLARTLLNAGITAMELTLRTDAALEALRRITAEVPDMFAGAGTVLFPDQVQQVRDAGADFAVAPGCSASVLDKASELTFPFAPGIATASDIERAISRGCRILKYFHAEGMGGISYLQNINSPYKFLKLRYIPLGGLGEKNMRSYLEAPEVIALGGSWIAPPGLIEQEDWDTIARNAETAAAICHEVRK
jgi:2-dehydro-3-deoxyphosphogluconate aldolase/(4S)-4-hydroxy-2-oxoglutarate aldolase